MGNVYVGGAFTDTNNYEYVAKWNGTTWSELGGTANALNANGELIPMIIDDSGNIYTAGAFTDANGYYYVAKYITRSTPLPVELVNFSGVPQNSYIELQWQTASEMNSSYFEVERSEDSKTFTGIGSVPAAGNSSAIRYYYYKDAITFPAKQVYYRLKEIDKDNSFTYSPIIVVELQNNNLSIYPNPTNGNVTINSPEAGQLTVYNTLGEAVTTQTIQAGHTTVLLDKAATGMYTIILTGQSNSYAPIKIIKN